MRTAFSQQRFEFTKRAHLAAQTQFYPRMFRNGVAFEDTTSTTRDLDYAIDCLLSVTAPGFRAPVRLSVQERFRQPHEMHWGDVTITEWNLASDLPSELHKLGAQMFVYGFYDEDRDRILLAVAVDVALLQWGLSHGAIDYERCSRGDQSFIALKYRALKQFGAVLFDYDSRAQEAVS
ncbi:MAG: hypothetical protein ACRDTH_11090 [Pseudonocardiaceae bacterium]